MDYRIEKDSLGEMQVAKDSYWAAQTQRSLENFPIGTEKIPEEVIRALAILKKACARTNARLGKLDDKRAGLISSVCEEIMAGKHPRQFPLAVWQTGSGTQSNMNINEVIANRGNEIAREKLLHPNDHVNMSQSSNDTFPSAMHIAAVTGIKEALLPSLEELITIFYELEHKYPDVVTTGRTHLQDATPIAFSQEVSGWRSMLEHNREMIISSLNGLYELALGGTAVGTGLNAPSGFAEQACAGIADLTGLPFVSAANKFHSLTAKDALAFSHGALKALAANLLKIANDIRWLASGPRCGLGEINLPANEPGSSIMPGKVNPTQCEALTMVAVQVMGNDTTISIAASQGNFQLNVFMPVIIYNFLQSVRLLTDAMRSFGLRCVKGITINEAKMHDNLHNSLMLATALNPYIGYDRAATAVKKAFAENVSLREATLDLGYLSAEEFDRVFCPEAMI